jgi:hypothetical protein
MNTVTRGQKIYFAAVGVLALWVGIWGYFIPSQVDKAIPWLVPPFHARFLGAMYLSGTAFMIGGDSLSLLSRSASDGTRHPNLDGHVIYRVALLPE